MNRNEKNFKLSMNSKTKKKNLKIEFQLIQRDEFEPNYLQDPSSPTSFQRLSLFNDFLVNPINSG